MREFPVPASELNGRPGPVPHRTGRQMALLLIVAMVSFALGLAIGRNTAPKSPLTTRVIAVSPTPAGQEKLTFYNTLPRGEVPALGSGINRSASEPSVGATGNASAVKGTVLPAPQAPVESVPPVAPSPSKSTVVAATTAPTAAASVPAEVASGYILQAASYPREAEAQKLVKKLKARGYKATVEATFLKGKGTWYRVYVGPYPDATAAQKAATSLAAQERLSVIARRR